MTWIDQLPDAAAIRAGNQQRAAVTAAASRELSPPGAEVRPAARKQLPASKGGPA
jgi:hypothetical protein